MIIEVRRRCLSVTGEQPDFEGLVWRYDGHDHAFGGPVPEGFVVGLLCGYVNGQPVDLAGLEAAIAMSGLPARPWSPGQDNN